MFAGNESQVVFPDIKIATRRPLWVRSRSFGALPSLGASVVAAVPKREPQLQTA